MKKILVIMLICVCVLITSCKSNPDVNTEENAASSEKLTEQNATSQDEINADAQENESASSQQKQEANTKQETLLPDEKQLSQFETSEKQEEQEIPPLVPIKNGVYRRTGDFDGLPIGYMSFSSRVMIKSMDEFAPWFNIENYIIVRGIKKNDSTSVLTVKDSALIDWYSETPIEVLDAYYGDVKSGDQIVLDENAVLLGEGEYASVGCDNCTTVIKKNVEYILFLSRSDRKTEDGKTMYSCFALSQSVYEIDEKRINNILSNKEYKSLAKDVYTIYYKDIDKLDRRLDVEKEIEKLYAKNGASELTDSQKELIDRLSKQYGAK